MASAALDGWFGDRSARLNELLHLHTRATGLHPGRRRGTTEYNRTLITALIAQFQAFARDLHDEAVAEFIATVPQITVRDQIRRLLTEGRKLDAQTPRRANLGADFGRLGIEIVAITNRADVRSFHRFDVLDALVDLRNAIGHGNDAQIAALGDRGFVATKPAFERHRRTLGALARTLDTVVATELARVLHVRRPW